jgi:site-specific recombinase XerD
MQAADIAQGPHQTAKGLRHAYGIHAISKGIPVTSVQKWLGHAQLSTTAIYVDFVGAEASDLATRMWE